ncbi:MAG: CvpA family protein [Desulfofustis sp.]|nr:CvpA family protein [Desulfofustis sp.]
MESIHLSPYDFVVLGIVALLALRGVWIGFLGQVVPLLALYLGYFAASRYNEQLLPFLQDVSDNPKVIFLSAYAILFIATFLVATLLGKGLALVIQVTIAVWFDRLLGLVLGLAKALMIVVLLHVVLGTLLAPENDMLRSCQTCPTLNRLSDITRELIRDEEMREALRQNAPAISLDYIDSLLSPEKSEQFQSGTAPVN